MKVNLGCGNDIRDEYVNVDIAQLPGIDIVHDVRQFPWPFSSDSVDEILMIHVLEHIPDTVKTMEEVWRITKDGAKVIVVFPFWNSDDSITDPTHVRMFNTKTLEFFDPRSEYYQKRSYYSSAKFLIKKKTYTVKVGERYFKAPGRISSILEFLAMYLCNIIEVVEFEMMTLKS